VACKVRLDVSPVDKYKGTQSESLGIVGALVGIGMLGITVVGNCNNLGGGLLNGGQVGSVDGSHWDRGWPSQFMLERGGRGAEY